MRTLLLSLFVLQGCSCSGPVLETRDAGGTDAPLPSDGGGTDAERLDGGPDGGRLDGGGADAGPAGPCGEGSCTAPAWRWDRTLGSDGSDQGLAVAVDGAGNAIVTGEFQGEINLGGGWRSSAGFRDTFVVSYGPDGSWRWDRTFGSSSPSAVAVDGEGNAVVSGGFEGTTDFGGGARTSAGALDAFVASYGPDGSWRWDRTFGEASDDAGAGVAMDGDGNAVVTGRFRGAVDLGGGVRTSAGDSDVLVASYGPDGSWRWDRTFGAGSLDQGFGVAVDAAGNAVVGGQLSGTVDLGGGPRTSVGLFELFVASYDADGGWRWDRTFGAGLFSQRLGVAVDGAGHATVTGAFRTTVDLGGGPRTSDEWRAFVASYDRDGGWRWDRSFAASDAWGVTVDGAGDTVVTGRFQGTADFGGGLRTETGGAVFVASFGSDGSWRWDHVFAGGVGDTGNGVAVDPRGNAVVTGSFLDTVGFGGGARTSAGGSDAFVLSLGCACPCRPERVSFPMGGELSPGALCDDVVVCVSDDAAAARVLAASSSFVCDSPDGLCCQYREGGTGGGPAVLDASEIAEICAVTMLEPAPDSITCVVYL
jgi:hypothetical protein